VALVDGVALDRALARVRALDAEGALGRYVADNDARGPAVGQVTFVAARRTAG
jgi:hypothetical protein